MSNFEPPRFGDSRKSRTELRVGLLTAGHDRPYVVPLADALAKAGIQVEFVGGDALACPEVACAQGIRFLNLRGNQNPNATFFRKAQRLLAYYAKLCAYAARTDAEILHIIWNNKFELLDRTLLMLYYRCVGKRVVFTAHNVNAARRDGRDSWLNRLSLRSQYQLCDHIFVHTARMKAELCEEFDVPASNVSVIPFGMNDTIPMTTMTPAEARRSVGLASDDRVLLFFGMLVAYKGIEDLVEAVRRLSDGDRRLRLVIAGPIKRGSEAYWRGIQRAIGAAGLENRVKTRVEFVPDAEVERYFKAADAVVIPYRDVFQSGVPFLAFNLGVPVIATDVGSLAEDVIEGQTGVLCAPNDPDDLARAIARFFASDLYPATDQRRDAIRAFARERHSWKTVSEITRAVYDNVLALNAGPAGKRA